MAIEIDNLKDLPEEERERFEAFLREYLGEDNPDPEIGALLASMLVDTGEDVQRLDANEVWQLAAVQERFQEYQGPLPGFDERDMAAFDTSFSDDPEPQSFEGEVDPDDTALDQADHGYDEFPAPEEFNQSPAGIGDPESPDQSIPNSAIEPPPEFDQVDSADEDGEASYQAEFDSPEAPATDHFTPERDEHSPETEEEESGLSADQEEVQRLREENEALRQRQEERLLQENEALRAQAMQGGSGGGGGGAPGRGGEGESLIGKGVSTALRGAGRAVGGALGLVGGSLAYAGDTADRVSAPLWDPEFRQSVADRVSDAASSAKSASGRVAGGLATSTGSDLDNIINRSRDFFRGKGSPMTAADREAITGQAPSENVINLRERLKTAVSNHDHDSVKEALPAINDQQLASKERSMASIRDDVSDVGSYGTMALGGGATIAGVLHSLRMGGEEGKIAQAALKDSTGILDANKEMDFVSQQYQDLHDQLEDASSMAAAQGWSDQEVTERFANPMENWLNERQEEDQTLGALAKAQAEVSDDDLSPEEAEQKREQMKKLAEAIRKLIDSLRGRSSEQEQDRDQGPSMSM